MLHEKLLRNSLFYVKTVGSERTICDRYLDDAVYFAKVDTVNSPILVINGFDADIKFSYETENECRLPFLDVQ